MASSTTNDERLSWRRNYTGPAFLKEGFRPLFLAAGLWAALAVPLWIGVWIGVVAYGGTLDPLHWHIHEMIFGFIGAAIGGFFLTAVPNWTGRLPVRGAPLAGLALLWLAGRAAMWWGEALGPWAAAGLDLLFFLALAVCAANEIVAGRNWRNLPILAALVLLLLANALFHLAPLGYGPAADVAVRLAIAVVAMLIALVGGRIVPSFTRNWLSKRGGPDIAGPMQGFDKATLAVSLLALLAWICIPSAPGVGAGLVLAGLLHLVRLARWKGWRTFAEPLVTILHAGYFWLGLGFVLLGLALSGVGTLSESVGLHVLTIGAMGTMILAVMTRAVLGHTGRALTASPATCLIYALVTLAAAGRVAFEFAGSIELLWGAAASWTAAFALFVAVYGPMAFRPNPKEAGEAS